MTRIMQINHDESIGRSLMLLMQTSRLVSKYVDTYFYKKVRLSFIKFMTLKILNSKGGVMTPSELAEWTQTERHNITTLVARLAKDGFIFTEPSDTDGRSIKVILTDKGREMLNKAIPIAQEIIKKIMSTYTETDAVQLGQMLEVLKQNAYSGLENIIKQS